MSVYKKDGMQVGAVYRLDGTQILDYAYRLDGSEIPLANFRPTAVVSQLGSIKISGIKQGGCTDGTYIYQTCGDTANYTYLDILKYKISDGTYTTKHFVQSEVDFGHANDMTYNPNNNRLYIPTMYADGSVIVLNASDLSYVETLTIINANGNPFRCWQLCFNRDTNEFLSPANTKVYFYDQNLHLLRSVDIPPLPDGYDWQSAETDGEFIYRLAYPNSVFVYTVSGDYVATIALPISGEAESIMYDWHGHFYIGKYTMGNETDLFYSVILS